MRPLNDRGRKDAPEMGRRLREGGVQPDLIVSSPAKRAIKTARLIAGEFDFPEADILEAAGIYAAAADELLKLIRRLPEEKRDVMLVGHNPGLTDWQTFFSGPVIENIPTCGVVRLAFERGAGAIFPRSGLLYWCLILPRKIGVKCNSKSYITGGLRSLSLRFIT